MNGLNLKVKSVDSMSALSSGIQAVNSELWNFRAHYDYMRTREPSHRELVEMTFTKLVWWSLLEATAPVFSETKLPKFPDIPFLKDFSKQHFPALPSPLGQVVATSQLFERIHLENRASMVGLLLATVDCLGGGDDVQEFYDRMTAHDLPIRFGLSKRVVDDFIRPTLLVGLFN